MFAKTNEWRVASTSLQGVYFSLNEWWQNQKRRENKNKKMKKKKYKNEVDEDGWASVQCWVHSVQLNIM